MNEYEQAHRIAAWTWAAETLGVEVSRERFANLADVTSEVSLENLKLALEVVIKTEPRGFLPSPGAVISASNGIAGRKKSQRFTLSAGESDEIHQRWLAECNAENWSTEMWQAYVTLMNRHGAYYERMQPIIRDRHAWAADQVDQSIGGRKVSMALRIKMRREFNQDARVRFPAPNPIEEINREVEEAIQRSDDRRLAEEEAARKAEEQWLDEDVPEVEPEVLAAAEPEVEEFEGPAFE
jgi:hypothetical protein